MENNLEKKEMVCLQKIDEYQEKDLCAILDLEKKCFPLEWQYKDAEKYYREMLEDSENIHIFLTRNDRPIGYVFGKPHWKMFADLKEDDVELEDKADLFYLESIQILPEARGTGGARKLMEAFCFEAEKKGFSHFSIHARVSNGFSEMVKKVFAGKISLVRKIERWKYGGDEPYEYLEWKMEV